MIFLPVELVNCSLDDKQILKVTIPVLHPLLVVTKFNDGVPVKFNDPTFNPHCVKTGAVVLVGENYYSVDIYMSVEHFSTDIHTPEITKFWVKDIEINPEKIIQIDWDWATKKYKEMFPEDDVAVDKE